jgi:hypothetical protein
MTRGAPGAFCLFWLLFWIVSPNPAFSLTAAGLVSGTALATMVTIALAVWTRRPASAGRLRLIIAMFGLQVGLTAALLLIAFGVPFPWAAATGVAVGGAMASYYSRGKQAAQLRGLLNQSRSPSIRVRRHCGSWPAPGDTSRPCSSRPE